MRFRRLFQRMTGPPPIFADLVLDFGAERMRIDVEEPGWLEVYRRRAHHARRVGLAMRGEKEPRLWVAVAETAPRYFSRVIGQVVVGPFASQGHRRVRVACLEDGNNHFWLHGDGTVEVGKEPTVKNV